MNFNIMQWFDFRTFIFLGLSFAINTLVVYAWHKKFYQKIGLKVYQALQHID